MLVPRSTTFTKVITRLRISDSARITLFPARTPSWPYLQRGGRCSSASGTTTVARQTIWPLPRSAKGNPYARKTFPYGSHRLSVYLHRFGLHLQSIVIHSFSANPCELFRSGSTGIVVVRPPWAVGSKHVPSANALH